MRFRMSWWRPVGQVWFRVALGLGILAAAIAAICWGRNGSLPQATALPPAPEVPAQQTPVPTPPPSTSDYGQRVVAYYNGNVPITREDLGEYLIARYGVDKLELLVNKRIIEEASKKAGVEVTAAEVEAAFAEDLHGMNNLPVKDFVSKVLKPYNKTLYEWKEDVIRPKLAMTKLCQAGNRVKVAQEDYEAAFQAYYGEKVDCRLIMWSKGQKNIAFREYEKIRESEEEFASKARTQESSQLAATGGRIKPVGRHTTGNEELEREAFSLRPGEISRVLETPEGFVVLKCDKRMPADNSTTLDKEKARLEKEIFDRKTQAEIPKLFQELRAQAQPKLILKKFTSEDELLRDVRQELNPKAAKGPAGQPSQGN